MNSTFTGVAKTYSHLIESRRAAVLKYVVLGKIEQFMLSQGGRNSPVRTARSIAARLETCFKLRIETSIGANLTTPRSERRSVLKAQFRPFGNVRYIMAAPLVHKLSKITLKAKPFAVATKSRKAGVQICLIIRGARPDGNQTDQDWTMCASGCEPIHDLLSHADLHKTILRFDEIDEGHDALRSIARRCGTATGCGSSQRSGRSSHFATLPPVAVCTAAAISAEIRSLRFACQIAFWLNPAARPRAASDPASVAALVIRARTLINMA